MNLDPDTMYDRLINEAPFVAGDSGESIESIEWYDPELIKEGRDFIHRHYASMVITISSGLVFGTCFKNVTTALLRTGRFATKSKAFIRHIETGLHVENWYESENILDPSGTGFKDIQKVRRYHAQALKRCEQVPLVLNEDGIEDKENKLKTLEALRLDLESCCNMAEYPSHLITYTPTVFFSQFDMVMVVFGMYSPILLFPQILGISETRGLKGYIHFFAVVGRLLGIQDKFNLALCPDKELHLKVMTNIFVPSLKDIDLIMLDMSQTYAQALSMPSFKSVLYAGLSTKVIPGFRGDNLRKVMSWTDVIHVKLIQVLILSMYYIPGVRFIMNEYFRYMTSLGRNMVSKKYK